MNMTTEQIDVINFIGSCSVLATAGSGKTTTIIKKTYKWLKENKTWKYIALITFTRKVAEEFRTKIQRECLDTSNLFIGTYHSFIMSEIIPFANTIWNTSKLNDKFIFDYNNVSIENFDEGLNYFLETGIINSYRVSLQKNGKEFISDLALKIIEDNSICQNYIYSKYDSIYNDEAQDYNESQINFLAFLYNKLKITLILVGDISQSIYGWRGAMPEYFKKFISETNLKCLSLSKNFRCHKSIQNYANKFKFLPIKSFKTTESRIRLVNFGLEDSFNWIKYVEKITLDYSSLTIIVYSFKWMLEIPKGFVKIEYCQWLENIHLPNWIIDFCKYILVTESSVFKLWDIFTNANKIKNKAMNKIKNILESLKKHYELQNSEYFLENTKNLFSVLNIDRDDIFFNKLIDNLFDEKTNMYFNQFKYSYKIMTIHGCKGLEFENVLIFTADYLGMFQINGKTKKEIEQAHNLHYVSCTRAREFLFVIHNKKLSKNNKLYWNDSYKEKIEEFYDVS